MHVTDASFRATHKTEKATHPVGASPLRVVAADSQPTASLIALTARARTALLAGFAANICF
jgi:hypothetical protein